MKNFLNVVYDSRDADETRSLYDKWSATYEAEVSANGYVTPGRCANALKTVHDDASTPILDFGCGTGLSGLALKLAGFTTIDGIDLSADMLSHARAKNVYRSVRHVDPNTSVPPGYSLITAIGVIGAGAAPATVLHDLMNALPSNGKFVVTFNDRALEQPEYEGVLAEWLDCGAAQLLFKERGDHLPGINVNSTVYILEKN